MKQVMILVKKRKNSSRYLGSNRIFKTVCKVAYDIDLVFHISFLKKCVGHPASIVPFEIMISKRVSHMRMFVLKFLTLTFIV